MNNNQTPTRTTRASAGGEENAKPFSPQINARSRQIAAKAVREGREAGLAGAPDIYERTKWSMERKKAREASALSPAPQTHFITPKSRSLATSRLAREIRAAFGIRESDDGEEDDAIANHTVIIVNNPQTLAIVMNRLIHSPHTLMRDDEASDEKNLVVRLYRVLTQGTGENGNISHETLIQYMTSVMFPTDSSTTTDYSDDERRLRHEIRRLMNGRLSTARSHLEVSSPTLSSSFSSPYLRSKALVASPIPSFTPHINPKSRDLDRERSLKLGLDITKPREVQIQQEHRIKADKRKAIDLVRSQMEQCTFEPHIISLHKKKSSAPGEEEEGEELVPNPGVRLYRAAERRRKEREEEIRGADTAERLANLLGSPEFTFHPRINKRVPSAATIQAHPPPPSFASTVERLRRASHLKEERQKEAQEREREAEERVKLAARAAKRDAKGLIVPEPFELRTSSATTTLAPYGARSPPRSSSSSATDALSLFCETLRSPSRAETLELLRHPPVREDHSSPAATTGRTVLVGGTGLVLFYVTLALGDGTHYEIPVRRGANPKLAAEHIASAYLLSQEHRAVLESTIREHLIELGELQTPQEWDESRQTEANEIGTVRVVLRPGVEVAVDLVPGDDCEEISWRIAEDYNLPDEARESLREQLEVYVAHLEETSEGTREVEVDETNARETDAGRGIEEQ